MCPARCLRFFQKDLADRVGWIPEDRHSCDFRNGFFEQLDPFAAKSFSDRRRYARDIAAWPSEAGDEAVLKRVRHCCKDDRDRSLRILCRESTTRAADNYDVYL